MIGGEIFLVAMLGNMPLCSMGVVTYHQAVSVDRKLDLGWEIGELMEDLTRLKWPSMSCS
jgi:hypothetical protein